MAIIKIQIRRGTLAAWQSANPILEEGELGLVVEPTYTLIVVGNGVDNFTTRFNDKAFVFQSQSLTDANFAGLWTEINNTSIRLDNVEDQIEQLEYNWHGESNGTGGQILVFNLATGKFSPLANPAIYPHGEGDVLTWHWDGAFQCRWENMSIPKVSGLQSALDAKEDTANKATAITGNETSNVKFPTVKAIYDFVVAAVNWVTANGAALVSHLSNTSNPHNVTKTQVGLSNVPNVDTTNPSNIVQDSTHRFVTDAEKAAWDAGGGVLPDDLQDIADLTPVDDDLLQRKAGAWTNRTPAQVKTDLALIKSDVGLSNVDNTSDLNKPISTATQTALNNKSNIGHTHDDRYYTETEINNILGDGYYSQVEIDSLLDSLATIYAPLIHSHDDLYYTEAEIDIALGLKEDVANKSNDFAADFSDNNKYLSCEGLYMNISQDLDADQTDTKKIPSVERVWQEVVVPFNNHAGNTSNPHGVTKSQVGLGNADNTSDANKPLSTAALAALSNSRGTLGYRATNRWYPLSAMAAAYSTGAFSQQNNIFLIPWAIEDDIVITQMGCEIVTTAGAAGSVLRMGIYACSPSTYLTAGSLVAGSDTGTVAADSTGLKPVTFASPITLARGIYLFALSHNSASSITFRNVAATAIFNAIGNTSQITTSANTFALGNRAAFAALPANFTGLTSITNSGGAFPLLQFKTQ
jgi:hypothetical protein